MKLWCPVLIGLLLLTVIPQASAQDKERIVVGLENESLIPEILKIPGVEKLKVLHEIKAVVLAVPKEAVERIRGMKGIKYVEIDQVAKALELSGYQDVLWNVKMINASKVWDSYYPVIGWSSLGKGIKVAVLDTGIDYTHPELKGKVSWCAYTVGTKTYTGTKLSNCADKNGHGTHVSGIIASTINNVGNAGVAPNVTLYAVKVLNNAGYGTYSDIAEGIILAVKGPDGIVGTEDDAKILSMSLGGSSDSSVLHDAVVWAYNNGAIIVAAAGNEGDGDPSTDNVAYPARYSEVIAVAAVDSSYNIPSWSSDGPEVDVAAPGVSIYSTYKNGGYATLSGTSMATPHVSATIALIQAIRIAYGKQPLTFSQMYETITKTAVDIGSPGFDVFSGYGLVDAYRAVQYALEQP
ncbi:MAG: peptidase S8 [Thermoproteota archaeon]|jgi:subtilisin family serine protease|uniref:Peptidase S8 n=1 Tax=Candidatus Methanodesulfokora washburnensis TaxID=2478471 RepID=A0A3R9PHR6_9CREN|nr:S8 family peptidase [Candidatus Methanodesulfokores washburnensis]RSN74571.1 peptidase S8 [Candidatus Methanodesulfokores washburnensis]TDA42310.1 MAG: peptidase S8 [Candidatus Korarchaeota archaeon]